MRDLVHSVLTTRRCSRRHACAGRCSRRQSRSMRLADNRVERALGVGFRHAHAVEFLFDGDWRKTRLKSQKIVTADIAPRTVNILDVRSQGSMARSFPWNRRMRYGSNSPREAALAAADDRAGRRMTMRADRATAGRSAQLGSSLSPNRSKKQITRRPQARPRPSQARDRGPTASAGTGPRPRRSGSGVDLAPETPGTKSSGPRRRGS